MNKILNYIAHGKGVGAMILLLFSFIIAFYTAINSRIVLNDSIPYMQNISDQLLPIKIENGKVVVPENTVKEVNLAGDKRTVYQFVIDTTRDELDTSALKSGLYLTRSYFYAVKQNEIRSVKLEGNLELLKQDYTPMFATAVRWLVAFIGLGGTILLFLMFFVVAILFAFCSGLATAINKKELGFDAKMRLSTLVFIAVYLLSFVLGWVGFNLHGLLFFLVVIAAQIAVVKRLPQ